MHDRQQPASGAESDDDVALLVIAAGFLHDEQWIVEYSGRLLEPHRVLTLVVGSLLVIPDKGRALVFVEAVHTRTSLSARIYNVNTRARRSIFQAVEAMRRA